MSNQIKFFKMKKLSFLGFFFGGLLLALNLLAAPISYKQAAHYAAQHFQTVAPLCGNVAPSLLYTSSGVPSRGSNDGKDYYVFGKPAGTGFVIVAGDDALPTILAYSDEGNFPVNDLPPHIASYLEGYSLWVAQARARGVQYTAHNTQHTTAIQPLLRGIVWDQGYPYNLFTPEIGGHHAPVGCVATALAQIMRYFSWPPQGVGSVEGYPEFGNKPYDWANMPEDSRDASQREKEAVAHLCHEVGRAVKMDYGPKVSGAYPYDAYKAMLENFNYAPSLNLHFKATFSDDAWQELLLGELEAERPISYFGDNDYTNGHAFVIDGYDGNNYYHVNWGWSGGYNGYFQLNQLEPKAGHDYSSRQLAIVGFCPPNQYVPEGDQHEIRVNQPLGGRFTVVPNTNMARKGELVKLGLLPDEGYRVSSVRVYEAGSHNSLSAEYLEEVDLCGGYKGFIYSFIMPDCDVEVNMTFERGDLPSPTLHTITVLDTSHGRVKFDQNRAEEGKKVFFSTLSEAGYVTYRVQVYQTNNPNLKVAREFLDYFNHGAGVIEKFYSFNMPDCDVTVSVEFRDKDAPDSDYELTIAPCGMGGAIQVSPIGLLQKQNSWVVLTVKPVEGFYTYSVKVYETDDPSTEVALIHNGGEKYSFTMPGYPVTVKAEFKEHLYDVTVLPSEHGTVTASHAKASKHTEVVLTVEPEEHYRLFTVKAYKTDDPMRSIPLTLEESQGIKRYKFQMPPFPVTIGTQFKQEAMSISYSSLVNGTFHQSSPEFASVDEQVSIIAVPNVGYRTRNFEVYKEGDASTKVLFTKDGNRCTFQMPPYRVCVHATFEKDEPSQTPESDKYLLTLAPSEHGRINASHVGEVEWGAWVSLTVTPESGYRLSNLKLFKTGDEATEVRYFSGSGQYSFQMPKHPLTVRSEFEMGESFPQPQRNYHLSYSSNRYGTLVASHVGDIPEFSIVTVTATPNEGYHLADFYVYWTGQPEYRIEEVHQQGNQYSFPMRGNLTVCAIFEIDAKPPRPTPEEYSVEVLPSPHGKVFVYSCYLGTDSDIALEAAPEDGYELARLELFKKGELGRKMLFEPKDMIPLETPRKKGFLFSMPAYDVSVRALFILKDNSSTPVDEARELDALCAPNPCRDYLRLENRGGEPLSYRVCSVAGELLRAGELPTGECIIDLSSLPEGLYLVHCTTPLGHQKTFKVVKQ